MPPNAQSRPKLNLSELVFNVGDGLSEEQDVTVHLFSAVLILLRCLIIFRLIKSELEFVS